MYRIYNSLLFEIICKNAFFIKIENAFLPIRDDISARHIDELAVPVDKLKGRKVVDVIVFMIDVKRGINVSGQFDQRSGLEHPGEGSGRRLPCGI